MKHSIIMIYGNSRYIVTQSNDKNYRVYREEKRRTTLKGSYASLSDAFDFTVADFAKNHRALRASNKMKLRN